MFAPEQMTNPPVQSLSEPATEQTESQSSNAGIAPEPEIEHSKSSEEVGAMHQLIEKANS